MAAVVLLAALCILSIFFFPAQQGPYAATHGPVTELRALIPSASLFLALILLIVGVLLPRLRPVSFANGHSCWSRSAFAVPVSFHDVIRC